MKCRSCGTEIAERALICFRCGTATTEAKFKAPPPPRRSPVRGIIMAVPALAFVAFLALYMGQC